MMSMFSLCRWKIKKISFPKPNNKIYYKKNIPPNGQIRNPLILPPKTATPTIHPILKKDAGGPLELPNEKQSSIQKK
jgi:hypothetical protein